jgi:MYXO-CTERM domain-containing protein
MSRLTARHPGLVFPALALLAAASCTMDPEAETPAEEAPAGPGAIRGELVTYVFDYAEGSQIRHTLRLPSGQERELRFAGEPELPASGTRVDVWGSDDGQNIDVSGLIALRPAVESHQAALINGTKKPAKKWAFVLVETAGAGNLSKAAAMTKLFSDAPNSIKTYYKEVSYGLQDLTGDVLGPMKIDATMVPGGLCQGFQAVGRALRPMIEGTYDQYLYYFLSPIRGCPWGGVAILGTAATPTRDSYYNASAECVVLVQEPGHNFGMVHSSAVRCQKNGAPVSMIVPGEAGSSCTHDEYGNGFDPMGGGSGGSQMLGACYHMNGVQKAYQDWLEGCNVVKATTSGNFTIYPLEKACNGTQVLQIPLPATRVLNFPPSPAATVNRAQLTAYFLELRAPLGLDRGLRTPRVFVIAAGNPRDARARGNNNWLIDMTPETRTVADAALAVGKTFEDPAPNGPKFTVVSADAEKAVINVQLMGDERTEDPGDGVCGNDMPFTGPGVATCEALAMPGTGGAGGAGGAGGMGGSGGTGGAGGSGGAGGMARDAGVSLPGFMPKPDAAPMMEPEPEPEADASADPPSDLSVKGGCSCRFAPADGPGGAGALPLVAALFFVLRRRFARR